MNIAFNEFRIGFRVMKGEDPMSNEKSPIYNTTAKSERLMAFSS